MKKEKHSLFFSKKNFFFDTTGKCLNEIKIFKGISKLIESECEVVYFLTSEMTSVVLDGKKAEP